MPSPGSYSLQGLRGGARGYVTLAAVATALFVIALVIVGAPLDGQLRFSDGSLGVAQRSAHDLGGRGVYVAVAWGGLYLLSLTVVLYRPAYVSTLLSASPHLWFLLLYLSVSAFWSPDLGGGLLEASQLAGTLIVAGLAALRYRDSPDALVRHAAYALGLVQLLNLAVILVIPDVSVAPHTGRWTGIYGAPNYLGGLAFCAIWANAAAIVLRRQPRLPRLHAALLLISVINLLGTNSVTSVAATVAALCVMSVWPSLAATSNKLARPLAVLVGGIVMLAYATGLAKAVIEWALSLGGRTPNLTGRVDIWSEGSRQILDNPVFGHGLGAVPDLRAATSLTDLHSGYFTLAFHGGVIACAAFLCFMLPVLSQTAKSGRMAAPLLALIVGVLLQNISESYLLSARSPSFLLFFSASILVLMRRQMAR